MSPKSGFAKSIRLQIWESSVRIYMCDRRVSPRQGSQPRAGSRCIAIPKAVRPEFVRKSRILHFRGGLVPHYYYARPVGVPTRGGLPPRGGGFCSREAIVPRVPPLGGGCVRAREAAAPLGRARGWRWWRWGARLF